LKDAFIDCQTPDTYEEVCAPKATAMKHLDELSRKLSPSLDYFVCFSSISCGRGIAGQTNYGYANSVMERICEQRKNAGFHGLAIQWGIIGEVGVVHRNMGDDAMISGVCAQNVKSCLDTMDLFCQGDSPVVSSYMVAVSNKKGEDLDMIAQIEKILGIDGASGGLKEMRNRTLGEMGIDSLLGVELQQMLEYKFHLCLTMQELLQLKVNDLYEMSQKVSNQEVSKDRALISFAEIKLPPLFHMEPMIQLSKVATGTPIFIVNIGDFDIANLSLLAQTLYKPVYVLQWIKTITAKTMEDLAAYFLEVIKPNIKGSCHLIGFSIGGSLALEMARQSEKSGLIKSITLLDGSTNLQKKLNKEIDIKSPEVDAFTSFAEQFSPEGALQLKSELLKSKNLNEMTRIVVKFFKNASIASVNNTEITDAAFEFMRKVSLVRSYIPKSKLNTDIILIEDPHRVFPNDISELKRVFSQIINGKILIHRLLSQKDLTNKEAVNQLCTILKEEIFSKESN